MNGPKVCPCCNRPFPPPLPVTGPVRQRIVNIVANRPDGITRGELMDLVYSHDPNGGPSTPNTICVTIHAANEQLRPQGYRIRGGSGPGSRYYLERLAENDDVQADVRKTTVAET